MNDIIYGRIDCWNKYSLTYYKAIMFTKHNISKVNKKKILYSSVNRVRIAYAFPENDQNISFIINIICKYSIAIDIEQC